MSAFRAKLTMQDKGAGDLCLQMTLSRHRQGRLVHELDRARKPRDDFGAGSVGGLPHPTQRRMIGPPKPAIPRVRSRYDCVRHLDRTPF